MAAMRCFVCLALLAGVAAVEVTPIAKVIELIEGLQKEVQADGAKEAKSYDDFACGCNKETRAKSKSIKDGDSTISEESANIEAKTAEKRTDQSALNGRKVKQEGLSTETEKTNVRCAKEKADYEAQNADTTKAISSLAGAVTSMKDSKPKEKDAAALTLLQGSLRKDFLYTIKMADAMGMVDVPKRKAITSMLQSTASVDPEDPEFAFHSDDIIEVVESLHKQFKDQKSDQDNAFAKKKKGCDEMKKSLAQQMKANKDAMDKLDKNINKLEKEIGAHRESLIDADEQLKFDELYMRDLTERCEARAKDWDQRSGMRKDELQAFHVALELLKGNVKSAADEVNQRALLQTVPKEPKAKTAVRKLISKPISTKVPKVKVLQPKKASVAAKKPISFVQTNAHAKSFLAASLSTAARKDKALTLLSSEGQRLGSVVLTTLAQRSAADPFAKVKGLVQKLVERLVQEATEEATKKGFCDTEVGKAEKERDFRREDTQDISADLQGLEAKRDALEQELKELKVGLKEANDDLEAITDERAEDKEANANTLKTAHAGVESLHEAILTLQSFYKQAAKASFIQASPVEITAGFAGSYSGKQTGSKAVMDLLETISSDFDRTIRTTEASEAEAQRAFVKNSQQLHESIASKEEKTTLNTQDLKSTKSKQNTAMVDLESAQSMLDAALKELEELKPMCIDSGMSYKERVEKREEEVEALHKAMCILDKDGSEPDCHSGGLD